MRYFIPCKARDHTPALPLFSYDCQAATSNVPSATRVTKRIKNIPTGKYFRKYSPCRFVVITGGEPCLQLTGELVRLLHKHNFFIAIETNGTMPICDDIDWVVCSPKFEFCPNAGLRLQHIDELKVVYKGNGQDMSLYDDIRAEEYCLQPCDVGDADENRRILRETIDYVKAHSKWRLSLQTHKILGIR